MKIRENKRKTMFNVYMHVCTQAFMLTHSPVHTTYTQSTCYTPVHAYTQAFMHTHSPAYTTYTHRTHYTPHMGK